MSEQPVHRRKAGGMPSWLVLGVVSLLMVILVISGLDFWRVRQEKAVIATRVRSLVMSMKAWGQQVGGYYPFNDREWPTANAGFRQLIQDEFLEDEKLLGAVSSPYHPDGVIGSAPEYTDAALAGENHWMVAKDRGSFTSGNEPLIFDNALNAEWPPKWRYNADKQPVRGRTLFGGMVVIGFNDASVRFVRLVREGEYLILPSELVTPPNRFEEPLQIADIEEKK